MTRSEKLAKEEKIEVYIGSFETAKVIPHCNAISNLRYIGTDDECLYNGKEAFADVYEEKNSRYFICGYNTHLNAYTMHLISLIECSV